MRNLRRILATSAAAAALVTGLAASAHADAYQPLNARDMEQTVLRAQMPRTLGNWTQNYYAALTQSESSGPTVCWNAQGDVQLPVAKSLGTVAYAVSADSMGSVTVYQYASAAKAKAALVALRNAKCSDNPVVKTDAGQTVKATSGSDFTDASRSSLGAGLSYPQDDKMVLTDVRSTQRGLAVIQTEIFQAVPNTTTDAAQMKVADRLGSVNAAWHKNAVRAYESFGQGSSR